MKTKVNKIVNAIAGVGSLIAFVGIGIAIMARHPVAILFVVSGMALILPAAIVNSVRKVRLSRHRIHYERVIVKRRIAKGQPLSTQVPKDLKFTADQRKFWTSWPLFVFFLCVSVVFSAFAGWLTGAFILAVGLACLISMNVVGGRRRRIPPAEGNSHTDNQGAIYQPINWNDRHDRVSLPPAIFSTWRNYHFARRTVRFCLAAWVFFAALFSFFAGVEMLRNRKSLEEGLRLVGGGIVFAMVVTSLPMVFALVVGAGSWWRLRRWERREESKGSDHGAIVNTLPIMVFAEILDNHD